MWPKKVRDKNLHNSRLHLATEKVAHLEQLRKNQNFPRYIIAQVYFCSARALKSVVKTKKNQFSNCAKCQQLWGFRSHFHSTFPCSTFQAQNWASETIQFLSCEITPIDKHLKILRVAPTSGWEFPFFARSPMNHSSQIRVFVGSLRTNTKEH